MTAERVTLAALLHSLYCEPMGFVDAHVGTMGDGGCVGRADRLLAAGVRVAPSDKDAMEGVACDWDEDGNCRCVRVAPSPTEPPCGDDSWDTRYECVKPSGHPVEGPGLTSHEYRFKRATSRVAPSPETPGLREAAQAVVDSALLTEFGPDEEFWTVHSEALAALRAAIAAEPKP